MYKVGQWLLCLSKKLEQILAEIFQRGHCNYISFMRSNFFVSFVGCAGGNPSKVLNWTHIWVLGK